MRGHLMWPLFLLGQIARLATTPLCGTLQTVGARRCSKTGTPPHTRPTPNSPPLHKDFNLEQME